MLWSGGTFVGCLAVAAALDVLSRFQVRMELTVLLLGLLSLAPAVAYVARHRVHASPLRTSLFVLLGIGVALAGTFLFVASVNIRYPADILIWSESDFVNDILKLQVGYPLYTAQENNESFTYGFGAQALTYVISLLLGMPQSIPSYRAIQLAFIVSAAGLGVVCCRQLWRLAVPDTDRRMDPLLVSTLFVLLLLFATNKLTNPFVAFLHNDALAVLFTVAAYALLLSYAHSRSRAVLVVMAVLPALGFFIKQNLILWAPLYTLFLLFADRPRSLKRVVVFAASTGTCFAIAFGTAYAIWRDPFIYWTLTVLGSHGVSPLESFQHLLDVWIYFAAGLFGGAAVLASARFRPQVVGCWIVWLLVISIQTYTSGIAWMLNHIGPGSLLSGIWLLSGLALIAPKYLEKTADGHRSHRWWQAAIAVSVVGLAFSGMDVVRFPTSPLPPDAGRYVADIEREFENVDARDVLLDVGTWVYLPHGIVMKDRAPSIGERGYSATGDFSAIRRRLEQRQYRKILTRKLNTDDWWYDHSSWRQSSGIRAALLANYQEIHVIPGVNGWTASRATPYGLSEISVLVPKP